MSLWELAETSSLFTVSGVRERMKEKKNGILKTAKLNASLASKIKTKTINNSSIIKVSLKQNNKALAMALNAAKIAAQRHTEDKMLLQKEVELCHFENACLRQKLSSVSKYVDELWQLLDSRLQNVIKISKLSENGSCSLLLNDGGQTCTDNFAGDQDGDSRPFRAAPKSLRVPLSHVDDEESENVVSIAMGISTSLQMPPIRIPASGVAESLKSGPPTAEEKSSSSLVDESLASNEKNCQRLSKVDGATSALNLSTIFGDNLLSVPPSSRSCSLSVLCKNSSVQQCEEIVRPSSDSMVSSSGHVTKRKKRRTDLSAGFGGNSTMGLSDNVPLDGLQWAKEAEPAATKSLDISQVGELVTLSTKNKSYAKIKANETKALKRVSAGKKDRDSSISQSKRNVDNYSNVRVDTAILSETNELSNSKINIPKPACPAEDTSRVDSLEEMVPLGSYGWKANYSSQHSDKTTGCTTSSWIDPAPPNHVNGCNALTQEVKKITFLEKMKNLGSQFQNPETSSLSNKVQQDEKSHGYDVKRMSQCSNKAKDCRRTYVVDPGPPDDENDCALFIHESKKKTHLDNFEDLGSWFQSPKSSSLNNKAPLSTIRTQQLFGFQTQIPSQEATLGLNIKRKKPKRRTQEIDVPSRFGEIEVQSVDINMNSQIQESKSDMQGSKTKKGYKGETAKAGRDNTQREHCRTDVEVFDLSENAPRVNKRKNKTSKVSLKSTSQANTISPASQGSMLSTFPVLLVDEATPVDSVHRNSAKMSPKVQGSSTTQNSSSSKTNSSSSQKAYWGVDNNVIGLKERVDSTAKLKKRTYTVKYVTEECVPSGVALQSPAECKTSQVDQAGWNFLRAPSSRTLRDSLIMDVTEVPPPLFDSLAICPNAPDSSSVGHSKIMLSSCRSFGHSCSMLPAAKDQGSTERFSALPNILTVSKKDDAKPLASTRQEKKTVQATPETLPKENENKVLKDLTNASPSSCHSIPLEVSPTRPSRRRNKEVCYAEPKINRKLRRGDPFTVTDFLSSPIYKTKSKKLTKGSGKSRKTKKMKEEDV